MVACNACDKNQVLCSLLVIFRTKRTEFFVCGSDWQILTSVQIPSPFKSRWNCSEGEKRFEMSTSGVCPPCYSSLSIECSDYGVRSRLKDSGSVRNEMPRETPSCHQEVSICARCALCHFGAEETRQRLNFQAGTLSLLLLQLERDWEKRKQHQLGWVLAEQEKRFRYDRDRGERIIERRKSAHQKFAREW